MPPPSKKVESFECSICCSEGLPITIRNKLNRIICPNCSGIFCTECQRQYSKGDCMNCHMEFKQSFILEHLGKSFIDKVIKPKMIEELMVEQRNSLKNVQPLVDWEKEVRKQKKNARFGIPITIPERPKLSNIDNTVVFPCPKDKCRGFVKSGVCGLCEERVCVKCRELIKNESHICNHETLMSIMALSSDTKPCPRCCAGIHKSEGCNHMFCTHCRTHFDWISGKILSNSSNGHYLNLQRFAHNVATREEPDSIGQPNCVGETFSIHRHRVQLDEINAADLPDNLVQSLWIDSNAIRLAKKKLYHEDTLDIQNMETLQELQVRYQLSELDDTAWSRNVYMNYRKYTLGRLYAQVFNIYLEVVDYLQISIKNNIDNPQSAIDEYRKLVELCNESFRSIQEEYGGQLHKFRNYDDDILMAPYI